MAADRRSIHPGLPGLPWWGAVTVAATATMAGIALDAGTKELTHIFAALYVLGCVTAVLTVRQSGVFTAVIQPPLLLFCAAPGAYWLFHGATFTGIKAILINCGYPLIERFPLMLFTSAGVLLIGMVRWYIGTSVQPATPKADAPAATGPGWLAAVFEQLATKLTAVLRPDRARTTGPTAARRRRAEDRPRRTATPPRRPGTGTGTGRDSTPTRSRHLRPPVDDRPDPRRRRPPQVHADQPPPRRRPRPSMDPYQPEPRRQQPRRPGGGIGGDPANGTHHPISRVRYRGTDPADF
ncbi:MAG TPA: DUF6542 domain-containing protein [Mycobacterium sp.]|nr:DUF6542 domain-containing protein [Mycobacterium sp.]